MLIWIGSKDFGGGYGKMIFKRNKLDKFVLVKGGRISASKGISPRKDYCKTKTEDTWICIKCFGKTRALFIDIQFERIQKDNIVIYYKESITEDFRESKCIRLKNNGQDRIRKSLIFDHSIAEIRINLSAKKGIRIKTMKIMCTAEYPAIEEIKISNDVKNKVVLYSDSLATDDELQVFTLMYDFLSKKGYSVLGMIERADSKYLGDLKHINVIVKEQLLKEREVWPEWAEEIEFDEQRKGGEEEYLYWFLYEKEYRKVLAMPDVSDKEYASMRINGMDVCKLGQEDLHLGEDAKLVFDDQIINDIFKNREKVLMVLPDLEVGGGQIVGINLANELSKKYDLFICVAREWLRDSNVEGMINNRITIMHGVNHYRKLRRSHYHNQFSNVISMIWWSDKMAYLAFKDEKINWILSMHGCYEFLIENKQVDPFFEDHAVNMLKRANYITYVAEKSVDVIRRLGIHDKKNTFFINNGVAIDNLRSKTKNDIGLLEDDFVFGITSRAIKEKGWEVAIEATKVLHEKGYDKVHLLLVGMGEYGEKLMEKEECSYIHFVNRFEHPLEWLEYDMVFDVGMLPSYSECLPMSIAEYLILEKPIIATNVGSIKQMLQGEGFTAGITIELCNGKPDSMKLALAMEELMLNRDDYLKYKRDTIEAGKPYSISACADNYEKLFCIK